jgi:anti-anti-sigma factor
MPAPGTFHFEIEVSGNDSPDGSGGNRTTTVHCHGNLVSETRSQVEQIFKDTPFRGQIVIDLEDVKYVDSAGLGALIRLKLSASKDNSVSVRFVNIAPSLMTLLRISNLEQWFTA